MHTPDQPSKDSFHKLRSHFDGDKPSAKVVSFSAEEHLFEAVKVLQRVRGVDETYPPQSDANDTEASLSSWLLENESTIVSRMVAIAEGHVSGHISVSEPHDYIMNFLRTSDYSNIEVDELCEITKFFVDPTVRKHGIGTHLFRESFELAKRSTRIPVLAVVDTSLDARRFYEHWGMEEVGTFNGFHGVNHVFIGRH